MKGPVISQTVKTCNKSPTGQRCGKKNLFISVFIYKSPFFKVSVLWRLTLWRTFRNILLGVLRKILFLCRYVNQILQRSLSDTMQAAMIHNQLSYGVKNTKSEGFQHIKHKCGIISEYLWPWQDSFQTVCLCSPSTECQPYLMLLSQLRLEEGRRECIRGELSRVITIHAACHARILVWH